MPVAEFRFRRKGAPRASRAKLEDAAESLLAALWKNGQVEGEHLAAWDGGSFTAWCRVPAADFLEDRYSTDYVADALQEVAAAFGEGPDVRILGDERPIRSPSWRSAKSLLLFTNFLDRSSPVSRGDRRQSIPLYALPLDQVEREGRMFWAERYRDTDSLWMDSGALEVPAYREMADVFRPLLAEARELARTIEDRTSVPTYTYLHRYYGRRGGEPGRRCPSCGRKWTGRGPVAAWYFPLRCDPCRLVTDVAVDFHEPRLARIGDYVPSSRPSGSRRSRPRRAR